MSNPTGRKILRALAFAGLVVAIGGIGEELVGNIPPESWNWYVFIGVALTTLGAAWGWE